MDAKAALRNLFNFLHLDLTKNLEYDRLTKKIMLRHIKADSNCIDIGCHKGEVLDEILKLAPNGKHFAFEPIPALYNNLVEKYSTNCTLFPYALADKGGETTFNYVKNAPAYSGLKKRAYAISNPDIEIINVEIKALDSLVSEKIDFIKIDVEGAEFGVLKGAKNLILKNKPLVVFEFGKGASDYYGTDPKEFFDFISNELQLSVYTLKEYIKNGVPLDCNGLEDLYEHNKEYYFVAV
jgi:FkbM family methyltransferase